MNKMKPKSRRAGLPSTPKGFTLIELLVVIGIILLLATLLIPTVQTIITQTYATKSAVRVRAFHDGALAYQQATRFLPGEKKDTNVPGGSGVPRIAMANGDITGSQVLAACLFNIEYANINVDYSQEANAETLVDSSAYTPFKPEYLTTYAGATNSLSDGFPGEKAKAICYYLASNNAAYVGKISQFRFTDNAKYMVPPYQISDPAISQASLEAWVQDREPAPNQILNNGKFLLIAPGVNRGYIVRSVDDPGGSTQQIQETDPDDMGNDFSGSKQ